MKECCNKAILILDMPETCKKCPVVDLNLYGIISEDDVYCMGNKKERMSLEEAKAGKPDWCPLQELPEKNYGK